MQEIRCTKCSKLLYKIKNPCLDVSYLIETPTTELFKPKIEIKCPRCGEMNTK